MKAFWQKLKGHPFLSYLISHFQSAEMDLSSIAVAYYLLLTLFPFLVLLGNILPYLNIDTSDLLAFLSDYLPEEFYNLVASLVRGIFSQPSDGLVWLSLLTAFWSLSKGFVFLQKAVNKAYDVDQGRDLLLGRLMGGLIGLVLLVFLVVAILLSSFGSSLLTLAYQQGGLAQELYQLLQQLLTPLVASLFFILLAVLYYLLPNVRIPKIRYVLPGSLLTGLAFLLGSQLVARYVQGATGRLEQFRVYGSVAIFALMLWFILFARLVILGAVLNASYQSLKEGEFETRRGKVGEFFKRFRKDKSSCV